MADKTKQRVRARMARTGETYQAAWNALHAPRPLELATAATAFQWRCDICGDDLFDEPRSGMVEWLYEPEPRPPLEYVAALFFCHKGLCDELVRAAASVLHVSVAWEELIAVVGDRWYDSSQQLLGDKRWSDIHDSRLATFFRAVSGAREKGWRPNDALDVSDEARARRDTARERALNALVEPLNDRLRLCFAPESIALERAGTKARMDAVEKLFDDPAQWLPQLEQEPELKERIETGEFPDDSFGAWLQAATRTRAT